MMKKRVHTEPSDTNTCIQVIHEKPDDSFREVLAKHDRGWTSIKSKVVYCTNSTCNVSRTAGKFIIGSSAPARNPMLSGWFSMRCYVVHTGDAYRYQWQSIQKRRTNFSCNELALNLHVYKQQDSCKTPRTQPRHSKNIHMCTHTKQQQQQQHSRWRMHANSWTSVSCDSN